MTHEPSTPSRFWRELSAEQMQAIEREGLETFKRHAALRHFGWQWHWRALGRSEQARFLLRHSSPIAVWRAFTEPTDLSDEAWRGVTWSRADRRLYAAAVRLLWRYAGRHGDHTVLALEEPRVGEPFPVHTTGRLVSQDLANSALEVAAIVRALDERAPARIIEVGGGYGRTAHALLHRFPEARYTIVDIEPARSVAAWYLGQLVAPGRVEIIDPSATGGLDAGTFDLALSISSLQEMTREQVDGYVRLFDRVAAGGVVYLKQWRHWANPADDIDFRFADLPIPSRWVQRVRQRCAVQTRFVEAGWRVPS